MKTTPDVVNKVLEVHRRLNSPYKVARELDLSPTFVYNVLQNHGDRNVARPERHGGLGRPEMRKWLVARTRSVWDNERAQIAKARARLAAGTHTMATGRDGRWLLLYSIPLRRPVVAQPDFFTPGVY